MHMRVAFLISVLKLIPQAKHTSSHGETHMFAFLVFLQLLNYYDFFLISHKTELIRQHEIIFFIWDQIILVS